MSLQEKITTARTLVNQQIAAASKEDICVTSSFQAEDMVVVHLVREAIGDVPVIFLDTGYHFAETYEYRDRLAHEWNLNLVNVLPALTVAEQESQFGILNQTAPDRCCGMRKVGPLFASLEPYRLWFTGLRESRLRPVPTCSLWTPSPCPPASSCKRSARWPTGRPATYGNTPNNTASRCCRFMKRATPASAVSHVPACRSIPMTPAPAAGVAASRNVVSTCNRNRRESLCCSC